VWSCQVQAGGRLCDFVNGAVHEVAQVLVTFLRFLFTCLGIREIHCILMYKDQGKTVWMKIEKSSRFQLAKYKDFRV